MSTQLPQGVHPLPVTQPLRLTLNSGETVAAIAMAFDAGFAYYLAVGVRSGPIAPTWVGENEVVSAYVG